MNHLAPLTALVRQATAFELPAEAVLSDAEVIEAQRLLGEARRVIDAVAAGEVSVDAVAVIRTTLGSLEATADVLLGATTELIAKARTVSVDRLIIHARQLRDHIDAEGVAAREQELREKRYLRLFLLPSGMTRITGELDPESAAQVTAVVDAATSPRRGGPRFVDPASKQREQRILDDTRNTDQLAVDALIAVLRIGLDGDVTDIVGRQLPAVRIHVIGRRPRQNRHRRRGAALPTPPPARPQQPLESHTRGSRVLRDPTTHHRP
jgi:hypothetical protein